MQMPSPTTRTITVELLPPMFASSSAAEELYAETSGPNDDESELLVVDPVLVRLSTVAAAVLFDV